MLKPEVRLLAEKLWSYHQITHSLQTADIILGLGSYDLRVAERCAELYFSKWAPRIIFSGYLGNWTKGLWQSSEAEIFMRHVLKLKLLSHRHNLIFVNKPLHTLMKLH